MDRARLRELAAAQIRSAHARPYDLRHTFASLLIWEGRPIAYVAQQLGHSPQTCLTTYAHVIDGVERNVPAENVIRIAREDSR